MDAPALATAGPATRGPRRLSFPAEAGLFVVGIATLAAGLGTVVPVVVWLALSAWWWGRPVGLVAVFAAALAIAVFAAPSAGRRAAPGAKAVPAALSRPEPPPPAATAGDSRRPLNPEGVWRLGIPRGTDSTPVRLPGGAAPAAPAPPTAVVAPPAPTPTAPAASPGPASASTPSLAPPSRASSSYKVVEVKDGGMIRGICRLVGGPASFGTVSHFKDLDKGCAPETQDTERVVVGEGRALSNCVVFLRSIRAGKDFPADWRSEDRTFTIDQKGCVYHPHIGVFRVATQVVVDNSDGADHNIHAYYETMADTTFNSASPPGKKLDSLAAAFIEKSGKYLVKCDIHPWMNAYLHVLPHPYYDVTSEKGAAGKKPGEFVLADVPPGEYEVVCWHEGMIETPLTQNGQIKAYQYSQDVVTSAKVTVAAGGTASQDFDVPYK